MLKPRYEGWQSPILPTLTGRGSLHWIGEEPFALLYPDKAERFLFPEALLFQRLLTHGSATS